MREFSREILKGVFSYCLQNDPNPRRSHITRLSMYQELSKLFDGRERQYGRGLSVSGSKHLANELGLKIDEIVSADFPTHSCSDLREFAGEQFDIYLSDQVLEHVEDSPQKVFDECRRVLRPGGVGIVTTCFVNPIHAHPGDFWRFTEEGLKLLAETAKLEVVSSGAWGNRYVWAYVGLGLRMEKIPDNPENPVYQLAMLNEPDVPIVTWIVFRKPSVP